MAKKKSKKKLIIIISFIVVAIIGTIVFISYSNNNQAITVTTSKVEKRTISQSVSAIGKIQPETEVKVSSETSGEIIMLGVKEGDSVRAGKLMVRIKPDIIESQLEQFKAAAEASKMEIDMTKAEKERAENDLKRVTELFKKEYASKQEYETSKSTYEKSVSSYMASLSRYQQSLATLKQIEKTASRTTIFSPITGIVTLLNVEQGEKVVGTAQMAGTEMLRVSDLSVMNAMVDVDENDIVLVKIGDTAKIEVDAIPDKFYKGVVVEMGHSALVNSLGTQDQVTNFKVKIRMIDKDSQFRPGMSCNVEIQTQTKQNVLAVPLQAVTVRDTAANFKEVDESASIQKKDDEESKQKIKRPPSVVFVKDGDKVKSKYVKSGISDKGFIEIIDGLKEGEVIVSGNYMAVSKLLKDGSKIKVDSILNKKIKKK